MGNANKTIDYLNVTQVFSLRSNNSNEQQKINNYKIYKSNISMQFLGGFNKIFVV